MWNLPIFLLTGMVLRIWGIRRFRFLKIQKKKPENNNYNNKKKKKYKTMHKNPPTANENTTHPN